MTSWSMGLIKTLNDTANHLLSSDIGVVIYDKFPKAQHHYLVLPKQARISSIYDLRIEHLPLLEELHLLAVNITEVKRFQRRDFQIGFHAQPSMELLHLHLISKDFNSTWLKTKKHWNSFNTRLFRPYEDVYKELVLNGCVERWDATEIAHLSAKELACNQCNFLPRNMPSLKAHLLQHWNRRESTKDNDKENLLDTGSIDH